MKKIFAKELAALAVLAIAFTGCNTAFDGTNANFSEKESAYTDRSGAAQSPSSLGDVTVTGTLSVTNQRNEMTVTVYSFSKINLESADNAIKFQRLTKNATNDAYFPSRGTELKKTRVKAVENNSTTTITYEVDGTGIAEDRVAFFVDAKVLKTKGGTPVLALDGNLKRGEESDSIVKYSGTNYTNTTYYTGNTSFAIAGVTSATSTGAGTENFRPSYSPIGNFSDQWLKDSSSKYTGVIRLSTVAANKAKPGESAVYEADLASKLNENVILQYREPGKREYSEKKLSFTYHADASTTMATDPFAAHSYTADISGLAIGTYFRVILVKPEGITVPDWYETIYGHKANYYYGTAAGARSQVTLSTATGTETVPAEAGIFVLHSTVPSYIVVTAAQAAGGTDATSAYVPTEYSKAAIKTAQASFFTSSVTSNDNWFEVRTVSTVKLDKAAASDFIVVDANNKKIDSEVKVIFKNLNSTDTGYANNGEVDYVKITVKDVHYRNSLSDLKLLVGSGTKIKENKTYPAQLTFGQWKDVADDDASGYVQIN